MDTKGIVLIVESDPILLGIYKEILELYDYDVQTATNGIEGVEKFDKIRPSLVVMEGDMPILDGYETFKIIRLIDKNANVVIITGDLESDPKNQELLDQGLIKVMLKPILVNELLNLAKRFTGIKPKQKFDSVDEAMQELTVKTNKFIKKLNENIIGQS